MWTPVVEKRLLECGQPTSRPQTSVTYKLIIGGAFPARNPLARYKGLCQSDGLLSPAGGKSFAAALPLQ